MLPLDRQVTSDDIPAPQRSRGQSTIAPLSSLPSTKAPIETQTFLAPHPRFPRKLDFIKIGLDAWTAFSIVPIRGAFAKELGSRLAGRVRKGDVSPVVLMSSKVG
jgi:hypothetical protein